MDESARRKKEYNDQRKREDYAEFRKRKDALHEAFGNECYLCGVEDQIGFHFHHIEYHPVESDYPRNSKSMAYRWKRVREAEEHPERFRMLCAKCHRFVEGMKAASQKYDPERLKELIS